MPSVTDGTPRIVRDVNTDPGMSAETRAACLGNDIGACVVVPLVKEGRIAATFTVDQPEPRAWTDAEVALVMEAAERTWTAVERARSEAAGKAAEALFIAFDDAIDQGFCTIEVAYDEDDRPLDYRFLEVNPAFGRQTGISDAAGRWMRDIAADQDDIWFECYGRVAKDRKAERFEAGSTPLGRWWTVYAFPIGEPKERKIAVLFNDVTAQKRAEEALRQSEERYRFIVEGAREYAMLALDPEGRITSWNSGAERIFGYREAEAIGEPGALIFTEEDRVARVPEREAETAFYEGQAVDERPHLRKDGTRFWASGMLTALYSPDGAHLGFVKVLRDNTKRKEAEAALHASEARFRAAAETVPDVLFTATPEGRVDYVNPRLEEITGTPPADVFGTSIWPSLLHPDDRESHEAGWAAARREERPFEDRHRLRSHDGSYYWFLTRARPVVGAEGRVAKWFGTCTDIHRIVEAEAEVQRLNATLEQRVEERSAKVHELARALTQAEQAERQRIALVLHDDLQQRLYGLGMTLSLLSRYCVDGEAAALYARAEETLAGAATLTRTLSHEIAPALLQVGDLDELLRWLADRQGEALGLDIDVEVRDSVPVTEEAVRVLLCQLLQEILFNVAKHADVGHARLVAERAGDHVRVTVEDEGAGFDPSVFGTVGEKRLGGLGLPSVRERLELVGGKLEIVSAPGEGTRVTVTIPRGFDAG